MKTSDLLDLLYDKLADNDVYEGRSQFGDYNYNDITDMYADYDKGVIVIGNGSSYWELKLNKVEKGE